VAGWLYQPGEDYKSIKDTTQITKRPLIRPKLPLLRGLEECRTLFIKSAEAVFVPVVAKK